MNNSFAIIAYWFDKNKPNAELLKVESGDINGLPVFNVIYREAIAGVGAVIVESLYRIICDKFPTAETMDDWDLQVVNGMHVDVDCDEHLMSAKDLDTSAFTSAAKYTKFSMYRGDDECPCNNCYDRHGGCLTEMQGKKVD